jgi:hypothetical protein
VCHPFARHGTLLGRKKLWHVRLPVPSGNHALETERGGGNIRLLRFAKIDLREFDDWVAENSSH